jgi:hypothetical protein
MSRNIIFVLATSLFIQEYKKMTQDEGYSFKKKTFNVDETEPTTRSFHLWPSVNKKQHTVK